MLNSNVRREAIEKLEETIKRHETLRKSVERASVQLFEQRQRAAGKVIERVEHYVNLLANSPKEFDKTVREYRIEVERFDTTVKKLEVEAANTTRIGSATGTAGAAAGVAISALAPSAAMAIATVFGTASTGTAISTLSGAAATNAALAWLGGGALAGGGGGMVAGNALLALAGPVGWTIGGMTVAGSAFYLHQRNGQLAEKATQERVKVEAEIRSLKTAEREISGLSARTGEHADGCLDGLAWLGTNAPSDYRRFNKSQKERLAALINHISSLSELLCTEVAL